MKFMKKLLFALPVIFLVAAGCNSSQPTTEQVQPTQQTQTTPTPQQQVAQNPTPTPTPTQQASNSLIIKEWGVEFTKPQGLADLQYTINPKGYSQNNTVAGFTTQKLVDLDKSSGGQCSDYLIGSLSRFTDKELNAMKAPNGPGVGAYVKVGGYYYTFSMPQEACSYNKQYSQLEIQQTNILSPVILNNLRATPAQ
jgi:hypothetical protein